MKAAYYLRAGDGHVMDIPKPICGDDEVIIKVVAASFCKGADLEHEEGGTDLAKYPVVPGHEFAGIVDEVGKNVTDWKVGDRVTADNTEYCMTCDACKEGRFNNCQNLGSLGHNINGGFAEYTKVKGYKLYRIPDHVSFNAASMTEMIACCIFAIDQAEVKAGENIAITGLGAAAAILCQLLKHSKVKDVVVIGSTQKKLDLIAEMGIQTVLMDRNDYSVHIREALKLHPEGYDAVIDTTAVMGLLEKNIELLRRGGRLCEFGVPKGGSLSLNRDIMVDREISYRPVGNQTYCFSRALKYLENGYVDGEKMVTATVSLDDYFHGVDLLKHDRDQLKVVVRPWSNIKDR